MKKIFGIILGAYILTGNFIVSAAEKYEILPDLPEPLAAAQASSVTTLDSPNIDIATNSVGAEPNLLSVLVSLIFVILLIYATGIIYAKLNKVGLKTLKDQVDDKNRSKVSVVSTTLLGNNKTLHVVELDGKRMLIGASANSIHLIKDLGSYPPIENDDFEYSKIEIPNIRIPKIEIPKIEFPNIGFTKTFKKDAATVTAEEVPDNKTDSSNESGFEFSEIYEESPDSIINKLFTQPETTVQEEQPTPVSHSVNPDEYLLYKKYL